jgi:hypothetical protein
MSRPLEQIQMEYQQQAALYGHATYQIRVLQNDATKMYRRMQELNKEARKASNKAPADSSETSPSVATEVPSES